MPESESQYYHCLNTKKVLKGFLSLPLCLAPIPSLKGPSDEVFWIVDDVCQTLQSNPQSDFLFKLEMKVPIPLTQVCG